MNALTLEVVHIDALAEALSERIEDSDAASDSMIMVIQNQAKKVVAMIEAGHKKQEAVLT
jgi:hypothetical protein